VKPDRLVDTLSESIADLEILRREPAADALVLEIGVEAFRKVLVVTRIADETGVELDWFAEKRRLILNQ
jgi:hypothetical protein